MKLHPLAIAILLASFVAANAVAADAAAPAIRSVKSGDWTAAETWDAGRIPQAGDMVLIHSGHEVRYDSESDAIIRSIHISGILRFASEKNTRLDVGLIRIEAGDTISEAGFDCDRHDGTHAADGTRPELLIGTADQPVIRGQKCLIRLHAIEGTDPKSWPAIVCCGGRMEIHGSPMERTWVKLTRTADVGATRIFLKDPVNDWNAGDQLLITGTARQEPTAGVSTVHVTDQPATEVRRISKSKASDGSASMTAGARQTIEFDEPLTKTHRGGEYSAEVANLSRNVVIESADPEKGRGHTMYHRGSSGSISYAEFRHLGKEGVLGRYPIHFHLVGDTMRGSSVIGVSVWDSKNRWITVHGTQYLLVRDCIGYQSMGHGFFFEDGTEVFNIFDRNLAVQALNGKPLPEQVLPFDLNDGAGFWWANSLNAFTRNIAVECDQHGFRFEAEKTDKFDPMLNILQPDGTTKKIDIRKIPFVCFDDNEAHCHRRFALNLGGIRGLTYGQFDYEKTSEDNAKSISGTTEGVGPDPKHRFMIRNFKVWDTHWAFHTMSPTVSVDGLDVFDCNYGIWRSVMDLHQYDNLSFKQIHSHAIFFPMGGHGPTIHLEDGKPSYPNYKLVDDLPPVTIVSSVRKQHNGSLLVKGTTMDNNEVVSVLVAGLPARSTRGAFAEWEIEIPADAIGKEPLAAYGIDAKGNAEPRPHEFASSGPSLTAPHKTAHGEEHGHGETTAEAATVAK